MAAPQQQHSRGTLIGGHCLSEPQGESQWMLPDVQLAYPRLILCYFMVHQSPRSALGPRHALCCLQHADMSRLPLLRNNHV